MKLEYFRNLEFIAIPLRLSAPPLEIRGGNDFTLIFNVCVDLISTYYIAFYSARVPSQVYAERRPTGRAVEVGRVGWD